MKKLKSALVGIDQGSLILFSDFEEGGKMWVGDGPRSLETKIKFSDAFQKPPSIQVSLSMWDLDQKTNPRSDVSAQEITETGFTIVFQTWGDTRIARVRADWFAIGEVVDDEAWDVE